MIMSVLTQPSLRCSHVFHSPGQCKSSCSSDCSSRYSRAMTDSSAGCEACRESIIISEAQLLEDEDLDAKMGDWMANTIAKATASRKTPEIFTAVPVGARKTSLADLMDMMPLADEKAGLRPESQASAHMEYDAASIMTGRMSYATIDEDVVLESATEAKVYDSTALIRHASNAIRRPAKKNLAPEQKPAPIEEATDNTATDSSAPTSKDAPVVFLASPGGNRDSRPPAFSIRVTGDVDKSQPSKRYSSFTPYNSKDNAPAKKTLRKMDSVCSFTSTHVASAVDRSQSASVVPRAADGNETIHAGWATSKEECDDFQTTTATEESMSVREPKSDAESTADQDVQMTASQVSPRNVRPLVSDTPADNQQQTSSKFSIVAANRDLMAPPNYPGGSPSDLKSRRNRSSKSSSSRESVATSLFSEETVAGEERKPTLMIGGIKNDSLRLPKSMDPSTRISIGIKERPMPRAKRMQRAETWMSAIPEDAEVIPEKPQSKELDSTDYDPPARNESTIFHIGVNEKKTWAPARNESTIVHVGETPDYFDGLYDLPEPLPTAPPTVAEAVKPFMFSDMPSLQRPAPAVLRNRLDEDDDSDAEEMADLDAENRQRMQKQRRSWSPNDDSQPLSLRERNENVFRDRRTERRAERPGARWGAAVGGEDDDRLNLPTQMVSEEVSESKLKRKQSYLSITKGAEVRQRIAERVESQHWRGESESRGEDPVVIAAVTGQEKVQPRRTLFKSFSRYFNMEAPKIDE